MRRQSSRGIALSLLFVLFLLSHPGCGSFRRTSESKTPPPAVAQTPVDQANRDEPQLKSPLPPPTGFVNDYAKVFDAPARDKLEARLAALKEVSAIEFAVVTVETTGGQPIFDYSLAVAKGWGIGPKDKSKGGGLLLLLAVKDRQWRLQVGRALEKDLPDDLCNELGERSTTLYKRGLYAQGLQKYVDAIIERLQTVRGFSLPQGRAVNRLQRFSSGERVASWVGLSRSRIVRGCYLDVFDL